MIVRVVESGEGTTYMLWCPACDDLVRINDTWAWDGNTERPTFTPSILAQFGRDQVCHSYLTAGVWHYLGDCTHDLAGQTAPVVDLPAWALGQ